MRHNFESFAKTLMIINLWLSQVQKEKQKALSEKKKWIAMHQFTKIDVVVNRVALTWLVMHAIASRAAYAIKVT